MNIKLIKSKIILGILFFLPVVFLLFLYPSTNNYNALDIVQENVLDFPDGQDEKVFLKDHLTVLGFLGTDPNNRALSALNLKEIIYDKFKGFKKFQVVMVVEEGSEKEVELLEQELYQYEPLKYWHFVYLSKSEIEKMFSSLKSAVELDENLSSNNVFVIDKELNQRGRIDDREDKEKEKNVEIYPLYSYNCIEVSELKNKMASEDMRVLFTEYRQKRKGDFDSGTRREQDLKGNNEEN